MAESFFFDHQIKEQKKWGPLFEEYSSDMCRQTAVTIYRCIVVARREREKIFFCDIDAIYPESLSAVLIFFFERKMNNGETHHLWNNPLPSWTQLTCTDRKKTGVTFIIEYKWHCNVFGGQLHIMLLGRWC